MKITQGDTAVLQLKATTDGTTAFDLTGAVFTTKVRGPGAVVSFDNTKHAVVSAPAGTFTLTLSAADTASLSLGSAKEMLTTVVQGGSTRSFRAAILTVLPPAPTS